MNWFSVEFAGRPVDDIQRFRNFFALFCSELSSQLVHPAIAYFNALLNEFPALIGKVQTFCTAIMRIFLTPNQEGSR